MKLSNGAMNAQYEDWIEKLVPLPLQTRTDRLSPPQDHLRKHSLKLDEWMRKHQVKKRGKKVVKKTLLFLFVRQQSTTTTQRAQT